MKEKFILKRVGKTKGNQLSFTPFGVGEQKSKTTAKFIRDFFRHHVSSTQYDAILREFSKDLKVVNENKIVIRIK